MIANLKIIFCLFLVSLISGCAGAGDVLYFKKLKYPTSMSAYLYSQDRNIVVKGKDIKVISNFEYNKRVWGVMYTLVTLSGDVDADLTYKINEAIASADGDGMINVAITFNESCGISRIPIINLLPIWPGCIDITATGEIVKVDDAYNG